MRETNRKRTRLAIVRLWERQEGNGIMGRETSSPRESKGNV